LVCSVPSNQLRQFLEGEVLSKYTFVFEQMAENAAPNGGDIQPWIKSMLGEMQVSIEDHINAAMRANK
jgi:hypothetical protein